MSKKRPVHHSKETFSADAEYGIVKFKKGATYLAVAFSGQSE